MSIIKSVSIYFYACFLALALSLGLSFSAQAQTYNFLKHDAQTRFPSVIKILLNETSNVDVTIIGHSFFETAKFKLNSRQPIEDVFEKKDIKDISKAIGDKIVKGFVFNISAYEATPIPEESVLFEWAGDHMIVQDSKGRTHLFEIAIIGGEIHSVISLTNQTVPQDFCTKLLLSPLLRQGIYKL